MHLFLFTLLLTCATTITATTDNLATELYTNVFEGLYDKALEVVKKIRIESQNYVLGQTINLLIANKEKNVIHFSYQLWNSGERDVVLNYFPKVFKLILNGDDVKIVNRKYGLPLKLDMKTDGDGDRRASGDGNNLEKRRLIWTFLPVWVHNRLLFRIMNVNRSMFLKMDVKEENLNRAVWGDSLNVDISRILWTLEPVWDDNQVYFYIINKQYGLFLKMGLGLEANHDRKIWGHDAGFEKEDMKRFQWNIVGETLNITFNQDNINSNDQKCQH